MRFRFFQRATYYTALILPGFSQIMLELSAARMCLVFGMLVRAGVPYLEGLEATRRSVLNPMVTKAVDNLYAAVRAGNTVTDALRRERLLPGIIARLVSSGEAAGSLDESLLRAGEYLMQNAHYRIRNASKFAGPVAVVVMGIIVLIIAVSFMGSYFEQIFSLLEE
jgi:type II secretory pathway component PulF